MRRADRLFRIVQVMRRRRLVTAAQLAEQLEVSERTIYRDLADLSRSGVPIQGEAGVGYRLDRSFDLPPLMFDASEVEALVLGARMVERWGDTELRHAARSILDKAHAVLPEPERERLRGTALFAMSFAMDDAVLERLGHYRKAIREQSKVHIDYLDPNGNQTERITRPLGLYFWGRTWSVAAYCELRQDFRNFRLDRVTDLQVLSQRFELTPPITLDDYVRTMRERDEASGC